MYENKSATKEKKFKQRIKLNHNRETSDVSNTQFYINLCCYNHKLSDVGCFIYTIEMPTNNAEWLIK